jgi:hypothetical protein
VSEKPSSEVFDAYMKAMQEFRAELDPLIPALLHTHLYAEHLLGRIIEHKLSGNVEDILKGRSPRFYFSHKLQLVIALDVLDEGLVEALWTLNELRNGARCDWANRPGRLGLLRNGCRTRRRRDRTRNHRSG